MGRGAEQDETRRRGEFSKGVEEAVVIGGEFLLAGGAVEGVGHAVADEDDGGAGVGDLLLELGPTLVSGLAAGLEEAEAGAGGSGGRVGAPAEVAEGDVAIGGAGGEHELDPAVVLFALDEGVTEEDNAVAVAELEARRRGVGGARGGEGEEYEQGGAEE